MSNTLFTYIKWSIIVGLSCFMTSVSYAAVRSFVVTVTPDTFVEGESVDFEIRAVDAEGKVDPSFTDTVFMFLNQNGRVTTVDYTLPGNAWYTFTASDQGVKKFSKALSVSEPGTYELFVEYEKDGDVTGAQTVIVTRAGEVVVGGSVAVISSPADQTVLDRTETMLLGTSDSPRTPISVEINGSLIDTNFVTDATGGFRVPIDGLKEGDNTVRVELKDADGRVLGGSDPVTVSVALDTEVLFQGFDVNPAENIVVGMEPEFIAHVADRVTSASLVVDGKPLPLDRANDGTYRGVFGFQDPGVYELALRLYVDGEMTEEDVDDIEILAPVVATGDVQPAYAIATVAYVVDPLMPGVATVSWEADGEVSPFYTVYYGTDPESLNQQLSVSRTGVVLSGLSLEDPTYVQVWPSSEGGEARGEPSDPLVIGFQKASPQCVVKGIKLRSEQRGSDYYLVWDAVKGANTYTVFRADSMSDSIADMSIVGTTTRTEYQYPFDPRAEYETYAYYAIQANCEGGLTEPVGDIEKVKTGPVSSALMVFLLVVGVYFLYRVNVYRDWQ